MDDSILLFVVGYIFMICLTFSVIWVWERDPDPSVLVLGPMFWWLVIPTLVMIAVLTKIKGYKITRVDKSPSKGHWSE